MFLLEISVIDSNCFELSTDSQFAVGVPGLLSGRVELVRLQVCEICTFLGSCISHFSCKIHDPTKDASLGKSSITETYW